MDEVHETYQEWQRRIRARDGKRCVKCNYHHAKVWAYNRGVVLCVACAYEREMMEDYHENVNQFYADVTFDEWVKMPSLRQFIAQYRADHAPAKPRKKA